LTGWPAPLQVVAHLNPLSYMVDALRTMMVTGYASLDGLGVDFAVMLVVTAGLVLLRPASVSVPVSPSGSLVPSKNLSEYMIIHEIWHLPGTPTSRGSATNMRGSHPG